METENRGEGKPAEVFASQISWESLPDKEKEELKEEIKEDIISTCPISEIIKDVVEHKLENIAQLKLAEPIYKGILTSGILISAIGAGVGILYGIWILAPLFLLSATFFGYVYKELVQNI